MAFLWTADLNTGIDIIDNQHRRIADYIDALEIARLSGDRQTIGNTLHGLLDYTVSHFAFEESLLEEAGYVFLSGHKRVHELFIARIKVYAQRYEKGEDIGTDLHTLLCNWLANHIRHDDADYVKAVSANVKGIISRRKKKSGGWLSRFFGGG